ncbi:MAG: LamG domain-containing protein, partial [Verrucomicrobiaceae bacterium]
SPARADVFFDSFNEITVSAIGGGSTSSHFASDFRTGSNPTTVTLARFLTINADSAEQQFTVRILKDEAGLPGEDIGAFTTLPKVAGAIPDTEPETVPAVAISPGIGLEADTTYWFDVFPNTDTTEGGFRIPQSEETTVPLEYSVVVTAPPGGGFRLSQDGGASYPVYTGPFGLAYQLEGFTGRSDNSGGDAYAALVNADKPVAYYRFEEAAEAVEAADSSGGTHNSVAVNGVSFGHPGRYGSAAFFASELQSYVNLPFLLDPGSGSPFSIEAWTNSPLFTTGPDAVIVAQKDDGGTGRSILYYTGSGNDQFGSFLKGTQRLGTETITVADNTWYHVVLTYSPADFTLRFYVNGVPLGESILDSHPESSVGGWVIGSHKGNAGQFVNGLIDEVAVYDYRLDDPNGDGNTADSRVTAHYPVPVAADLPPLAISPSGAASVALSFPTATGFTYQVSSTSSLAQGPWIAEGATITGDGQEHAVTVPRDGQSRFYRLTRTPVP